MNRGKTQSFVAAVAAAAALISGACSSGAAKGKEPCVDVTVEQWSGTGWSKVESRTLYGCGAIVLGKEVNTYQLWIPPRLLTVEETAELLQLSIRHVRRLIADGRLEVKRIGRATRVTPEGIAALLDLMPGLIG